MSIKQQAISGVKWTSISTIVIAFFQILKISVLTRFLDKADFGLMAIVIFVLGFMNLFADMGLTAAILHKQSIDKYEYSSLYWFNFLISIILFFIFLAFTPILASFYNDDELLLLIPLMGISIIISAAGKQFKTIEQKKLNFKFISKIDIISSFISLISAVLFAATGFGVYALVYSFLILHGISNGIFLLLGIKKKSLLLHFTFHEIKSFLKIGLFQVGSDFTNYLNRDIDILIIGKILGTESLGGYSLAKQLVRRPLQIIDPIINRVMLSVFPKFQDINVKLRFLFIKVLTNLSIINAIVYGSIAIMAPSLIQLLYGSEYLDIVNYVQLFSLLVFTRSLAGQVGVLVVTKGRTDLGFYWNLTITFLFPVVIYFGSLKSGSMVIIYLVIAQIALIIPGWKLFYKNLIGLQFLSYLATFTVQMLLGLTIFFIYYFLGNYNILDQMLFTSILIILLCFYSYFKSEEFGFIIKNIIIKCQGFTLK